MKTIHTNTIPIKSWASVLEDNALEQAKNLANIDSSRLWVALMPDAHVGFGMPIGGILATENEIIPNAVGVDIGCGMIARKTNLTHIETETLKKVLNQVQRDVPTGFAHHRKPQLISDNVKEMAEKAITVTPAMKKVFDEMPFHIGTLGGGNHFIELQKGNDDHIWIMIHSGSRGIGKMACAYFDSIAKEKFSKSGSPIHDLAGLPSDSLEGQAYLLTMKVAMYFAEQNRLRMLDNVIHAIGKFHPELKVEEVIDTHHNYVELENHENMAVFVHRKGAVRAVGKVIIPGSMGTKSYIGEGLCNSESFCSCSHGAGRILSRKEAKEKYTVQAVIEDMKAKHIELFKHKKSDVAEESAWAYKNIDDVMKDQADLVTPLVTLTPLGVVKG